MSNCCGDIIIEVVVPSGATDFSALPSYENDAAAAAGGVAVGQPYILVIPPEAGLPPELNNLVKVRKT